MSIEEIQQEIIEEFEFLGDWEERYRHIITLGKEMSGFPEEHRTNDNKVRGCQSQVWLWAEWNAETGTVKFFADSDAMIVKGLAALILRVYNNRTPEEIITTQPDFLGKIGLDTHLSQNRTNGFAAMVKQVKMYALGFQAKQLN